MTHTLLILNPHAGGGRAVEALERAVAERPHLSLVTSENPGDARRLAREAAERGAQVVGAAGGDGTVHEVVQGLIESGRDAALGIIPLGTGNDLVRSLRIPTELDEALAVLDGGRRRAMDVVEVVMDEGDPVFCANAASGGFTGKVHDNLDEGVKRFWGPLSYLRSAVDAVGEAEAWEVDFTIDGRQQRLRALNVVVANGRFAGRGIPIAPTADPFDGRLDVAVIREAPLLELGALAPALLRGENPDDDRFVSETGREVILELDRPMAFSLDGERAECRSARFVLREGRLPVVLP